MKCSARSFFKTFLSVVWFIVVVVNVMCLFHVVSGSEVTPKDSDSNVDNVTFSESLSENTILDKSLNSTGGLESYAFTSKLICNFESCYNKLSG